MTKKLGILGIGFGCALIAVNFSSVSTALSTIHQDLGASFLELQWMLNIFGIFLSSCLVMMGRLADTYGRKKIFLIGMAGAGLASLIAGVAPHPGWIIFAQMLQGIFGAILLAVSQALLVHLYSEEERGKAIGIWASIAGITLGLGPLLAGTIISLLGWRWIFFINIPVAIFGLFIVWRYVQESKSVEHRGELDYWGMLLLFLTIGFLVLGVIQSTTWGFTSIWTILCGILFIICLPLLILVERKAPFPIIHPEFFLKRDFLLPSLAMFCIIFFVWTIFFLFPLYFQKARGDTPLATGCLMLFITGPSALLSTQVGKWYGKVGPKPLMLVGFLLFMLSILFQFFLEPTSPLVLGIAAALAFGFGWLFSWGSTTTAALSSVPRDLAGIASGAFTTISEIGATVGLSITGTVFRASSSPFMDGFRHSLWVILAVMCLGLLATLAQKKR